MAKNTSARLPPKTKALVRRSRMIIQAGARRYDLEISVQATEVPPAGPSKLYALKVETRFLRLTKPAALGDSIDGWRVCWLGGWDKCKVFFIVLVERVAGASIRT